MKIEGFICHFYKANKNGEIVTPESFARALADYKEKGLYPALTYNHEKGNVIGKIQDIIVKADGLYMIAELNEEVKEVQDRILPLVKDGTLKCFSTEGYVAQSSIENYEDGTYLAKDFYLTAVSIVPVPADFDSQFTINGINIDPYHIIYVDVADEPRSQSPKPIRLSVIL